VYDLGGSTLLRALLTLPLGAIIVQNWTTFPALILVIAVSLNGQPGQPQQVQAPTKSTKTNTSEARSVVSQAKATALKIENEFQRGTVLDQIGAAEAKTGDLNAAADTANEAYPHTMAILTAIGEELARQDDMAKAEAIATKLKGDQSSSVFAFIAQRQAEKGNIAQVIRTNDMIHAPELRSEVWAWTARQQAANGDYSGARRSLALAGTVYPAQGPSPDDAEMMIAKAELERGVKAAARTTIASIKSGDARFSALISGADELLKKGDRADSRVWLDEALQELPADRDSDFMRYMAIPLQVELGQKERAIQAVADLPSELRVKGYTAVAVTCAEEKDVAGVSAAVEKILSADSSVSESRMFSDHEAKLKILNVTAALIDNGEFEKATRLLAPVEEHLDEIGKISIEPRVQFDDARFLALKMRRDSVAMVERGTALRTVAILQTKKYGAPSSRPWALALTDAEDRAYALLGIAQALLETDDVKLPYYAIFIH
jgi:hypothetical protein